jgi:phosphoribosyl 1,2-cyclic phosphate phosphodiesterase
MRFTILGCGTSNGVPVIGCSCPVCASQSPKNNRTRASLWIEGDGGESVLIDTSTEFRFQALREGVDRIDAVLYTHSHADHIHGIDDLRPLSHRQPIPAYGSRATMEEITERFSYIFSSIGPGGGKPQIEPHVIEDGPVREGSVSLLPVPLLHGDMPIYGYRVGDFAYLTDCSAIPEEGYVLLEGVEVLVIDALRYRPHPTHFHLEAALEAARNIGSPATYLTHMCHDLEYFRLLDELPEGVEPAYDGLSIEM